MHIKGELNYIGSSLLSCAESHRPRSHLMTPSRPEGMYVCVVITYSRVWINRVRLPVLLAVS